MLHVTEVCPAGNSGTQDIGPIYRSLSWVQIPWPGTQFAMYKRYQTTPNLLLQVIQLSVSEPLPSLISHTRFPTDAIKLSQPGLGVDILMFLFFIKPFDYLFNV